MGSFNLGIHGGCGGMIRVRDFGARYHPREFRYEAHCLTCLACDPNGYSSVKKTTEGATRYFKVPAAAGKGAER